MKSEWNKKYFDRRSYLLEHFHELSLSGNDLLFVLMLDYLNEGKSDSESLDIQELAKCLKRSEMDVMNTLARLVDDQKLELINTGRSVSYSLRPLFEDDFTADEIPQSLFDLFLEQFKRPLSSTEMDKLCNWMKEYEQEFIICALREAVVYKKLNFNYIDKILVTWKANGKTLEELNGK